VDQFQRAQAQKAEELQRAAEENRRREAGEAAAALALANAESAKRHADNMANARREGERKAQEAANLRGN